VTQHKGPRFPNPLKTEVSDSALRRDISPAMIAGLRWYSLPEEERPKDSRPTAATERSLVVRRLLIVKNDRATARHEITKLGRDALAEAGAP
jgi:hypothetical protein